MRKTQNSKQQTGFGSIFGFSPILDLFGCPFVSDFDIRISDAIGRSALSI
jgi:hypothetical protein